MPITTPEKVGLMEDRLKQVSHFMHKIIDEQTIAGGITVVARHGKIAHLELFGYMDKENKNPMQEDAIFRIYSMSKPITCAATMILFEECHFFLDDPVKDFIPKFGNLKVEEIDAKGKSKLVDLKRDVTIHDLLTHTGGLSYKVIHDLNEEDPDLETLVDKICDVPLIHQPGVQWDYSSSHDILGRIIEVISGKPFDVFLRERLFEPLGMVDTDFYVPEEKIDRLCTMYVHNEQGHIIPQEKEDREYYKKHNLNSGGGGLVSTTADYLAFSQMMLNMGILNGNRILSRKTVELMTVDHLPPGHPPIHPFKFGYGLGVSVLRSLSEKQGTGSVGEYGWGGAGCTEEWVDPQEDMVSMVMMQLRPPGTLGIMKKIKQAVYQAIE